MNEIELKEKIEKLENELTELNNLIIKQHLKDLALRLNKGVKINWNNHTQTKFNLYFDYEYNKLNYNTEGSAQMLGQIYCLDKRFLEIAKAEIGEEKLIELIKSGV